MNTILFDVQDHIATITLNRPGALNAMNQEMRQELVEAWTQVKDDDDIRLAIVTGAGRAFCAGIDIKEVVNEGRERPSEAQTADSRGAPYLAHDCPKPTIAAVNGAAAGGGLGIATGCDIIIAAEEAVFIAPFAARGTMNAHMLALLHTRIPYGWSAWMGFSASRVDAATALRIGLVNEVLPRDQLMDRAYEMAERILANSQIAILAMKEKLRQMWDSAVREALTEHGPYMQNFLQNGQVGEGFTAFAEKRRARFD